MNAPVPSGDADPHAAAIPPRAADDPANASLKPPTRPIDISALIVEQDERHRANGR